MLVQRHADKTFGQGAFAHYGYTSFTAATAFYQKASQLGQAVALVVLNQSLAGTHCVEAMFNMLHTNPRQQCIALVGDSSRFNWLNVPAGAAMPHMVPKPWQKDDLLHKVALALDQYQRFAKVGAVA
jgi:hypothetical protein